MLTLEEKNALVAPRTIQAGTLSIGRDAGNDICLDLPSLQTVAFFHARIRGKNDRWVLEDMGSPFGTFVNGARVSGHVELCSGDTFILAGRGATFRVTIEADADVPGPGRRTTGSSNDERQGNPIHLTSDDAASPANDGSAARLAGGAAEDDTDPVPDRKSQTSARNRKSARDRSTGTTFFPRRFLLDSWPGHLLILFALLTAALATYRTTVPSTSPAETAISTSGVRVRARVIRVGRADEDVTEIVDEDSVEAHFQRDLETVLRDLGVRERCIDDEESQTIFDYLEAQRRPRSLKRTEGYLKYIVNTFRREGAPEPLVYLPWVESQFDPAAQSAVGARGLWQFIPGTAKRYGLKASIDSTDERLDWKALTGIAARYLSDLMVYQKDDWDPLLAVASYNWGEANVWRSVGRLKKMEAPDLGECETTSLFWLLRRNDLLPAETAEYVPKFLAAAVYFSNPSHYPSE